MGVDAPREGTVGADSWRCFSGIFMRGPGGWMLVARAEALGACRELCRHEEDPL